MKNITIVIVEDHPLFRRGVADRLSMEDDLDVIGEAGDGESGLEVIRSLEPDIAILDVNLPKLNGQQVTQQIVAQKLKTKVIFLTAYDDSKQVLHSMKSGAAGYCAKYVRPDELVKIVRYVNSGNYVIGEHILTAEQLNDWLTMRAEGDTSPLDVTEPFHPLSKREMEVVTCLTRGMSNKEIAANLGISHQTVKNHVTSILRKLGVEDRTQAVVFALKRGWVRLYDQKSDN